MKKNKKMGFTIVMCLLLILITIGVTYAAFIFSKEGTIENTLETGTIVLTYTEGKTGITLNEAYPMSDDKGKLLTGEDNVFDFTVQANLSRKVPIGYEVTVVKIPITDMTPLEDNEVKLYLERAIDPDTIYQEILAPTNFLPRGEQSEIGSPIGSMVVDSGVFINKGITIHHYRLKMWVDEDADLLSGVAKKYGVKINVYAKQDVLATPVEVDNRNEFITAIYQYDQTSGSKTFCVTGEEATCVEIKKAPNTYEVGTILKYKVNDQEEKYFYVLKDNGDTLTLQQRENTVNKTPWYGVTKTNKSGPLTILNALEEATKNWSNVLDQTYTLGTTIFKDNAYTGCSDYLSSNKCTTNVFKLGKRIAKARMITIQEIANLSGYRLEWIVNYLAMSHQSGIDYAYWTSSAVVNDENFSWAIISSGPTRSSVTDRSVGGRAVINVLK